MRKLIVTSYILSTIGFVATLIYIYTTFNNPLGSGITTMGQAQKVYLSTYWWLYIPMIGFGMLSCFLSPKFWKK
jgi:hypothetical protein